MILDAEKSGRIKPGDTLIEPTSGNTGIGLSLTAAVRGYNMIITLPQKMSQEKVAVLEGLGAHIIRTPTEAAWDAPESHIGVAKKLNGELPNSHILDQYGNPSNPLAHYTYTAEEILTQCNNQVDMVVLTAGTGGTITGVARKIKERLPHCKIIGVDPKGSILAGPGPIHSYKVEGIGYDFVPDVLDRDLVDEWIRTEDKESFLMARRLIREEGILCGGSSGAAVVAALEAAKRLESNQRCVVIVCDGVRNYMSKLLDEKWCIDWGYIDPPSNKVLGQRAVSDLSLTPPVTAGPETTCQQAAELLLKHGLSHLPIVSQEKGLEGVVSQVSLTDRLLDNPADTSAPVTAAYLAEFREILPSTSLGQLRFILKKEEVAFVVQTDDKKKKELLAVVTQSSLLALAAHNH